MENTPLNKAHEAGRRARRFAIKGQLPEAGEWHLKAVEILESIKSNLKEDSLCKRSIEEQVEDHTRQAELIKIISKFVEKHRTHIRRMAEKPVVYYSADKRAPQRVVTQRPLPHPEIQKKFDEADSLLQILSDHKYPVSKELNKTQSVDETGARLADFTIRPKNQSEVVEELQTCNANLRLFVDKLLNDLNECREELNKCQEENRLLRLKYEPHTLQSPAQQKEHADSNTQTHQKKSGSSTAQGILTENTAGSATFHTTYEQIPTRVLPDLEPLPNPEFNFTF